MKWLTIWIAAALCGAWCGWRPDKAPNPSSTPEERIPGGDSAVHSPAEVPIDAVEEGDAEIGVTGGSESVAGSTIERSEDWLSWRKSLLALAEDPQDAWIVGMALGNTLKQGEFSPKEVYELLLGLKGKHQDLAVSLVADVWWGVESEVLPELFVWLREQDDSKVRAEAQGGVLREWLKREPSVAAAYVAGLAPAERKELRKDLLSAVRVASQYGEETRILNALPPEERVAVLAAGFAADKRNAGRFLSDPRTLWAVLEGQEQSDDWHVAQRGLAAEWGAADPQLAMRWVSELPVSVQQQTIGVIAESWVEHDAHGLSEYLLTMPDGVSRDVVTANLVAGIVEHDPDSAWQWAAKIGVERHRREAQRLVSARWQEIDPERARQVLESEEAP